LRAIAAATLLIGITAGCKTSSAPHAALVDQLNPLAAKSRQEALRKAVQADPFPTAAQAGL